MERVKLDLNKGDEVKWEHEDGLRRGVVLASTDKAVLIFVTSGDEGDGFLHRKHWCPKSRIRRKTGKTRSLPKGDTWIGLTIAPTTTPSRDARRWIAFGSLPSGPRALAAIAESLTPFVGHAIKIGNRPRMTCFRHDKN